MRNARAGKISLTARLEPTRRLTRHGRPVTTRNDRASWSQQRRTQIGKRPATASTIEWLC